MADLASLGRQHYVSQAALSAILAEIKQQGIPEATSRSSVKRARDHQIDSVRNMYGTLMVQSMFVDKNARNVKDREVKLPLVHPWAFLQHCLDECGPDREFFKKHILPYGTSPDSPLESLV